MTIITKLDPATHSRIDEVVKTYNYGTDSSTGTIKARDAKEALKKLNLTSATIADGAWGWVEAADGSEARVNVAKAR